MTNAWLFVIAAPLSCILTYLIWMAAESRRIHDVPNERSMHRTRIAIGAGWAIVFCVLILLPGSQSFPMQHKALIIASMLVLAGISWLDDLRSLPPLLRLVVQAAVIGLCLSQLSSEALAFGGVVPRWLDRLIAGIGWLWFVNLFNFMDGIDGITGTETIGVALGYGVLSMISPQTGGAAGLAWILVGAAAGFLVWNWSPSRIILGDVGSIPLGFLLGWLMLDLAVRGHLAAALILPMHHLADATYTLIHRFMTVPEPWRPHRQHFYQRAVLGGQRVPQVVIRIAVLDVALIALAVLSITHVVVALVLAVVATGGLLAHLGSSKGAASARKI